MEKQAKVEAKEYIDDLNKAINEDRVAHGKKPLKFDGDEVKEESEEEKENYFDDNSQGGNTSGYGTPPRLPTERKIRKYIPEWDVYICPEHKYPEYVTTGRNGYKEYKCKGDRCANCPRREECLSAKQERKSLRRHVWEDFKVMAYAFTHTEKGKSIYKRRKETVERSFADSKELYGLRYCRMRGLSKVAEQCLLTAAVQNMKKTAHLCRRGTSIFFMLLLCFCKNTKPISHLRWALSVI